MPISIALGAIAGATIFLGLPIALLKKTGPKLRGFLNAVSTGILIFILVEIMGKMLESIEELYGAALAPVGGPELVGPDSRQTIAHLCRPLRNRSADFLFRDFIVSVRRLDPARCVARLSCPLLLVHGRADEIVPFPSSERIFAAAREPKTFVRVPGARHDFLDRRDWLARLVSGWLVRQLGR